MIRVTNSYPDHKLSIEVEGLEPVAVTAKWGSVLAEEAERAFEGQGVVFSVCGTCRHFLQTNLTAEWSNGFSGYCQKSGIQDYSVGTEIHSHCDEWDQKSTS
jgi:hypothetical protein